MANSFDCILNHYNQIWNNIPNILLFQKGPFEALHKDFRILEYPPTNDRNMWTYATCGMSMGFKNCKNIELHIFSPIKSPEIVELLTSVAYYHTQSFSLDLNHTINFGKSWQKNSLCKYGFISLPYLDGPPLENYFLSDKTSVHFYWIIPITEKEREYKIELGTEKLDSLFDISELDYLNIDRESLV